MSLEQRVLHSFQELLPVGDYGPEVAVLLADVSFIIGLSNFHFWAYQALYGFDRAAESTGKRPYICVPRLALQQYERHYHERTPDEFGIPLAAESLDEIFSQIVDERLPDASGPLEEARAAWSGWQQKRVQFAKGRGDFRKAGEIAERQSPGIVDTSLLLQAIQIAETGAHVYVASSDFKDIINPLLGMAGEFRSKELSIKALHPSKVSLSCFGAGFKLEGTLTGEALKELQAVAESRQLYSLVVFEKVRSGDAQFLAGVGIVQKRYFRPLEFPKRFEPIPEGCRELVPVFRVKSFEGLPQREVKKISTGIAELLRLRNTNKVVLFEEDSPYTAWVYLQHLRLRSPKFATPAHSPPDLRTRLFRADPEFLRKHTTSLYAAANYRRPPANRSQH